MGQLASFPSPRFPLAGPRCSDGRPAQRHWPRTTARAGAARVSTVRRRGSQVVHLSMAPDLVRRGRVARAWRNSSPGQLPEVG